MGKITKKEKVKLYKAEASRIWKKKRKKGMGIITEGKISGNLPSNVAFAVHYPAYPSSMERAIETLGGIQAIAKVSSLPNP